MKAITTKKELTKLIKDYNEEIHFASGLSAKQLLTLDESEIDEFILWVKTEKKINVEELIYKDNL